MPVNDFNVGRDVTFTIFDKNGGVIVDFNIITGFDRKQKTNEIKVKGIDGTIRYAFTPDGWEGTIELDRADSNADAYFAQLEELYFSGANVLAGQITETTTEVSGNITQFRYERTVMAFDDAGKIEGDKEIKLKIKWAASRRRKIKIG
jgi:hypothetical protein